MQQQKPTSRYNRNRAQVVDENFIAHVKAWSKNAPANLRDAVANKTRGPIDEPAIESEAAYGGLTDKNQATCRDIIELFESQMVSRHQDIAAREMRARDEGYYTISSAGHEGNAVVGRLTRHTDMAFLHYRDGALIAERARQLPEVDFIKDSMLSFAASVDDPISGGRHKVWGSVKLWIPPQTSTIASHLPKAVGAALSLTRATRKSQSNPIPADAIIVVSFGDASTNHAAAQTAFNAAAHAAHQRLPVPILFVCEDNGLGISVKTPKNWIESSFSSRHGLSYFKADGLNLLDAFENTCKAVDHCRRRRKPTFLHLKTVRMLGHAGSDVETEYHSWEQIEENEAKDPLIASANIVLENALMSPDDILHFYESTRQKVNDAARAAAQTPKLDSADEIIKPLAPSSPDKVLQEAKRAPDQDQRVKVFEGEDRLPERSIPRHLAVLINQGLTDLFIKYPEAMLFGEDVAKKGGVYHVTTGLTQKFGVARVFNTLLDETTILGLALGAGHLGMLPVPEIQYLAYYHNAQDQIRGEACSLQFFSNDQFRNPMVIRIAGWAYQKGFGGHFHNDNSITALRDVPGLIVCSPSRGDDAVKMLRTCFAMAKVDGRVIAFIEPIARYMTKDLYEPKDQQWSFAYPPSDEVIPFGEGKVYHEDANDLTILTFANGTYMSLRAAKELKEKHNINARVVDLRWLCPLNESFIVEQALSTKNVLIVDEGRKSGGINEALMTILYEQCGSQVKCARLTGHDTYIPLGPAADCVLPLEDDIVQHVLKLVK